MTQVPRYFARARQLFEICHLIRGEGGGAILNHYIQRNAHRIQSILEIIVMPGDGLAPLGTRTFTGTAVTIWRAVLEISYDQYSTIAMSQLLCKHHDCMLCNLVQ